MSEEDDFIENDVWDNEDEDFNPKQADFPANPELMGIQDELEQDRKYLKGLREEEINEQSDDDVEVERTFNFVNEISIFADYEVINKYTHLLKSKLFIGNKSLTTHIETLFIRILTQLKSEWIFFQIDYLSIFGEVLGTIEVKSNAMYHGLREVLKGISESFFNLAKNNSLVITEAAFKYPNRIIKTEILNNYEDLEREDVANVEQREIIGYDISEQGNKKEGLEIVWTEHDDNILIENYIHFRDLPKCLNILTGLINDPLKTEQIVNIYIYYT